MGEHDDDVRLLTRSHGLVNSAMGQIPCSTERISCSYLLFIYFPSFFIYLLLPILTAVTDIGFLPLFVCVSCCLFLHDVLKPMQLGSLNLT